MPRRVSTVITALVVLTLVLAGGAQADPLRVCADPDNLPFTSSDMKGKGLYLELADLLAARMDTTVEPLFFRMDAGRRALRPTLLAGRCDVHFGMPSTADRTAGKSIILTRPFLDLGYALLAPKSFALRRLTDFDGKNIGVQFASTPQTILSVRDAVRLVTFRTAEEAVDAVGRREIDAAFVWGPIAGYRASRQGLLGSLKITSVTGLGLRWRASIGVRTSDQALRDRLDREIAALEPVILKLAEKYHVPLDPPVDLEAVPSADTPAEPTPIETAPGPAPAAPPGAAAPAALPSEDHTVNPYHGDPAAAKAGRTLFNVHCSHCHSPNAQSPDPVRDLRLLHHRYGDHENDVFWTTVTQGRPAKGMPTWGPILNEDTIWKIKTFLESVQRNDAD